jgi:TadE-like protein
MKELSSAAGNRFYTDRAKRNSKNEERGQSLVELALVVPILMLIAFGVIEFGRAYYQYNTLTKAVRDGARYMSYHIYNSTEEGNCAKLVVYGNSVGTGSPILPGLTTAKIQMLSSGGTTPYSELNPPKYVTVRVDAYPFSPVIPFINLNASFSPQCTMLYVGPGAKY